VAGHYDYPDVMFTPKLAQALKVEAIPLCNPVKNKKNFI